VKRKKIDRKGQSLCLFKDILIAFGKLVCWGRYEKGCANLATAISAFSNLK
jgi:hypothetical protein